MKFAQVAYQYNSNYTRDLLMASLHEVQLVDRLLKYKMIKIQNGHLVITDFGHQTVTLYLQPKTAYWIRKKIPWIDSWGKFYRAIMYAYDIERHHRVKASLEEVLKRIIEEDHLDFDYHLKKIANELKVNIGDLEEFVEGIRWITHCFHELALMDANTTAQHYTETALAQLIPSRNKEENETL